MGVPHLPNLHHLQDSLMDSDLRVHFCYGIAEDHAQTIVLTFAPLQRIRLSILRSMA